MMNRTKRKMKEKLRKLNNRVASLMSALDLIADMTSEWPTERVAIAASCGDMTNVMTNGGAYISFDKSLPEHLRVGEPAWERDLNPRKKEREAA